MEVFGGSAALLFAKPPSPIEVYNDLDGGLVHFFRTLRDPKRAKRLKELLDMTLYAREEWIEAKSAWRMASDEVEMARRWYTALCQSFSKDGRALQRGTSAGWSFSRDPEANPARKFRTSIDALPRFCERLAEVQIEQADFRAIIPRYDTPETVFYLDPPYLPETRRTPDKGYGHEMTYDDHHELLDLAFTVRGMVIISGYPSPLYDERLAGWECISQRTTCSAAGRTRRAAHLQGEGSVRKHQTRTECIWLNPAASKRNAQLSLFPSPMASHWTDVDDVVRIGDWER